MQLCCLRVLLSEIVQIQKGKQINGENLSDTGRYYVMNGGVVPSGYYTRMKAAENKRPNAPTSQKYLHFLIYQNDISEVVINLSFSALDPEAVRHRPERHKDRC